MTPVLCIAFARVLVLVIAFFVGNMIPFVFPFVKSFFHSFRIFTKSAQEDRGEIDVGRRQFEMYYCNLQVYKRGYDGMGRAR